MRSAASKDRTWEKLSWAASSLLDASSRDAGWSFKASVASFFSR